MDQETYKKRRFWIERIQDDKRRENSLRKLESEYAAELPAEAGCVSEVVPACPGEEETAKGEKNIGAATATFEEVIGDEEHPVAYDNCVKYARSLVPSLPMGLTSAEAKRAIINSQTPVVGSVAVIDSGTEYDHVAVVKSIFFDGKIEITEANWGAPVVGLRTGTPGELKILGYFSPDASAAVFA